MTIIINKPVPIGGAKLHRFYIQVYNKVYALLSLLLQRVASSSQHERVAAMGSNEGCGIVDGEELEEAVQFHKKKRSSASPAAPQNTASSPPDDPRGTANFLSRMLFWWAHHTCLDVYIYTFDNTHVLYVLAISKYKCSTCTSLKVIHTLSFSQVFVWFPEPC